MSYRMGPESPRGGFGGFSTSNIGGGLATSNIIGIENSTDRGDEINLDELQKYIGGGPPGVGGKRY
jgi:hypothetical protein